MSSTVGDGYGGGGEVGTVSAAASMLGRQYVRDRGGVLDVVVEMPSYPSGGSVSAAAAWFDAAALVLAAGAVPVNSSGSGCDPVSSQPVCAEDFGEYCYLPAVKPEYRELAAMTFGKSVVTARLAAPAYAEWLVSDAELHELSVTGVGSWCHLERDAEGGGTRLDGLLAHVRSAAYEGRRDIRANILIGGPVGVVPAGKKKEKGLPSFSPPVSVSSGVSSAFEQLQDAPDFSVCKCRIHRAPLDVLGGEVVGCCLKRVGAHPAVGAAAAGKDRFCHASPATRAADRALLELMEKPPDVPSWKLDQPIEQVAALQSDLAAEMRIFGRGYCFLDPVYARIRWRTARLFGSNSDGKDVLRAWDWVLRKSFKPMECVMVAPGFVHIRPVAGASGVDPKAGEKLRRQLADLVEQYPGLRVGYTPPVEVLCSMLTRCDVYATERELLAAGFAVAVKRAAELGSEEKRSHRMLEALGDAYLSAVLALAATDAGASVQAYQELRSAYTFNPHLTAIMACSELGQSFYWPAADYKSITAAKAYEAVAGVVARACGVRGVAAFAVATGLLPPDVESAHAVRGALVKVASG